MRNLGDGVVVEVVYEAASDRVVVLNKGEGVQYETEVRRRRRGC